MNVIQNIFQIIFFLYRNEKTAFHAAVKKGNINIVRLLLANQKIEINKKYISYFFYLNLISNIFCDK